MVYEAELKAVKSLLPEGRRGMEVGVGTGRFAVPFGIEVGIEPSTNMGAVARGRGIKVLGGVAEDLPLKTSCFDVILMVTTLCFLDDVNRSLRECRRVLRQGGYLIIGFVDRTSLIGRDYVRHRHENVFYREATFYSVGEVIEAMSSTGFHEFTFSQTIFEELSRVTAHEEVRPGYGKGSFVVIRGKKV